jgi:lactate dehydrogenase-like 2-hydroxyacid dehydrogenase
VNPAYQSLSNVILTPHCGSNTHQARYEMALQAAVRIQAMLAGQQPENLLNPEALQA